jgi:hypothetical protein
MTIYLLKYIPDMSRASRAAAKCRKMDNTTKLQREGAQKEAQSSYIHRVYTALGRTRTVWGLKQVPG